VFRWAGVAAPAQRCFQGLCFGCMSLGCAAAQYGTSGGPGARGLIPPGTAGIRPLVQSGSGRSEVAMMAWPPSLIANSHDALVASDLSIGNPSGHRSTPLSAGRLRGCLLRPDFMVHLAHAVGKCQNQVPYSSAVGKNRRMTPTSSFVVHAPQRLLSEAEGRDLQWRKRAVPRAVPPFAGGSSAPSSAHCVMIAG
jgi:hypothetical protein